MLSILIAAVLVTLVTGCGGAHRYDERLVQADSLMQPDPDSALATLTAIDSLTGEGNLAYRDLLLTQARYKCYADITAGDDSAITRTMDYYRAHSGEREKLTRAYLYKGAVMEELGHIDSAMFYYKTAEANAAPKDYFTLGYVNMRMGALYREHYSLDGKDIEKYELANKYLKLTDDKHYQLRCKINLGTLYRLNNPDRAETMLKEAMSMAKEMNDSSAYVTCIQNLIALYDHCDKYEQARKLINHLMLFPQSMISHLGLTTSARVYAKLGMIDSAENLLSISSNKRIKEPEDMISLYEAKSAIALEQGDSLRYLQFEQKSKNLFDSLIATQKTIKILNSENEFDIAVQTALKQEHKRSFSWLAGLCFLVLSVISLIYYRHVHRYDRIIEGIKQQSADQLNDLSILNDTIENLKIQDNQLKCFISSHFDLMREMIEACYHNPQSKLTEQLKKIVQFQQHNGQKWTQLYHYIDAAYNNLISKTQDTYPQLNDKELMLIALVCLGFSYIQIAIIMGYSNATSVSTIKQRLAKKMHLQGSLNDYIDSIINNKNNAQ